MSSQDAQSSNGDYKDLQNSHPSSPTSPPEADSAGSTDFGWPASKVGNSGSKGMGVFRATTIH